MKQESVDAVCLVIRAIDSMLMTCHAPMLGRLAREMEAELFAAYALEQIKEDEPEKEGE